MDHEPKGFSQFEIIKILVSSFRFIWIPVLYVSTAIMNILLFQCVVSTLDVIYMNDNQTETVYFFWLSGPGVVVSTAAFHARARDWLPDLGGLKETKMLLPNPLVKLSRPYCGEPLLPRGSVLGLRPPWLEFLILCLEGSVTSLISPSSGGSPGPS